MLHTSKPEFQFNVPFLANPDLDCGPLAVAMVAKYFGIDVPVERIKELALPTDDGVTSTFGIARAAGVIGLRVHYCTRVIGLSTESASTEYFARHAQSFEVENQKVNHLIALCRADGAIIDEKVLSLKEILERLDESTIPIALLDWNVVRKKEGGYEGHFLPIVGRTREEVLVHHSGPIDPQANMPIPFDLFQRAHHATGTDMDVLFLSRK